MKTILSAMVLHLICMLQLEQAQCTLGKLVMQTLLPC
nr:MAG TPA: hypothetical protein [Caudoviricetes sp.]